MAGKTIGQLVNYVVNMQEFDLVMTTEFSEINTMSPLLVVTTTGGLSGDGNADCSISCGDISGSDISRVSQQGDGNYRHEFRFRNVGNGVHSCSVNCDDDLINQERDLFVKDVSLTINTPELIMEVKSPVEDLEYNEDSLRLVVETTNGVYDNTENDGKADCYWNDHLVDGFIVGDSLDITKKRDVSLRDWSNKISSKTDFGSGFRHTKNLNGEFETGENTIYVQCKDEAGKLTIMEEITFSLV